MHMFWVKTTIAISCSLIALTAASSTATTTTTAPEATDSDVSAQYKLYKFVGCRKDKQHNDKQAILDALSEAHQLLGADGNYNIDNHWHGMGVVEFFGSPTDLKSNEQRPGLKQNLRNGYSFTNGWWLSSETTAIYCHDGNLPDKDGVKWSQACGSSQFPGSIVVAPDYHGKDKPALMFWFDLSTLDGAMKHAKKTDFNGAYDLSNYENRARAWITAMMLIPNIGAYPKNARGDRQMAYKRYNFDTLGIHYATTAAQCKWITKLSRDAAYSFTDNPDNISWYAMASYVEAKFGEYPIQPFVPLWVHFD